MNHKSDEAYSVAYTTEKLEEDMEITGMAEIQFYASSTADEINFIVKLFDVFPDGKTEMVTRAWLNSSYRESNMNPRYPEDWKFVEPTKIIPGAINKYKLTITNTSYVFKEGHRIRLVISSSDWPSIWPNPSPAENEIYSMVHQKAHKKGGHDFSYLLLPVVPRQYPPLPEPNLPGRADAPWRPPTADYWIDDDIFKNGISANYKSSSSSQDSLGKYWTGREWEAILPKNNSSDHVVNFKYTWIMDRAQEDDIKFVYTYTVDKNGPQVNVDVQYGGPFPPPQ
jgi:hypothetical protein